MLPCPACRSKMSRSLEPDGGYWGCGVCGGRALTLGAVRKVLPREAFDAIHEASARPGEAGTRRCHLCGVLLRSVRAERPGEGVLELDGCQPCGVLWFDRGEVTEVPPHASSTTASASRVVVQFDRDRPMPEACEASEIAFRGTWHDIPAVLGLPVELDNEAFHRPWTTWAVALAILALSVLAMATGLPAWIRERGLVPATPFRHGGLDFLTSILLHAGIWHLASNLYFLLLFGDNVEDVLRPPRYLLLLFGAAVAGKLCYLAVAGGSDVPSVGASGGISGILAYYALAFPRARIRTTHFIYRQGFSLTWSARWAFGIWVALQVLGAFTQVLRLGGGVNYLAHLGGAIAGVLAWLLWREG